MRTNFGVLVTLALLNGEQAPCEFEALSDAFAEAEKQRAEEAKREAVGAIKELMSQSEQIKAQKLATLRRLREQEKALKEELDEIDAARAYAAESSNFVPWAKSLGKGVYDFPNITTKEFEKLSSIPKGWQPGTKS